MVRYGSGSIASNLLLVGWSAIQLAIYGSYSFTLDQPAHVTIKVYNVAGQLVEWIAQQRTFGSGKQALRWSGRDSDGEVVATGLYIVTVTVGSQTQDKVVNVWNH